jgi:GTP:adenosylcobinamide-phosphate guanylyltransferase
VLAGSREPNDPLAVAMGVPCRALLDIRGQPMVERVLRCLLDIPCIDRIAVSIDEPQLLEQSPRIAQLVSSQGERLVVRRSASSPSRSVLAALDELRAGEQLLVTTADHALLTRDMVEHFLTCTAAGGADVGVALVASRLLRARFPEAKRTYLPFRGERYSGANLFAFMSPEARRAAEFWTRAEQLRKSPWRLVSVFGPVTLALFLARRLDLRAAFERASRVIGARIQPIEMPSAEAAVDVDKLSDLELVLKILEQDEG